MLDLQRLEAISITVLDALADLDRELGELGIALYVAALPERAEAVAVKTEWYGGLTSDGRVHESVDAGLAAASAR